MRKGLSALITVTAGLVPMAVGAAEKAAATCTAQYAGGGLMNGVCQECFSQGNCRVADFFIVGNTITKLILGLSGSVMLLMIIYGGFLWLTSSGNSSLVDKGKKVLIGSIVGLIIVFGAYTATQFILGALGVSNVAEVFSRPFQTDKSK